MGNLNTRLARDTGIHLAVRLGVHTGLVVVGEVGGGERHERLALGDTPNVAARRQGLAEPDTLVISSATVHLVQGVFALEDLGTRSLKGVEEPIGVARVLGSREGQQDEDAAVPAGGKVL